MADEVAEGPRVYADANIPAGVVGYMRARLGWDVLFVIEHADLRRGLQANLINFALTDPSLLALAAEWVDRLRQEPPGESLGRMLDCMIAGCDTYTGVAATWARVTIPNCIAFIVELGPELSDDEADVHAAAVLTIAGELDELD